MQAPVRDLKARLSEYLRLAAQGEEVIVTLHGRPIARLVPMGRAPQSEHEALARLNAMPWVRPGAGGVLQGSRSLMRIAAGGKTVSGLLAGGAERPKR
jgi:prevent-host-death family protein